MKHLITYKRVIAAVLAVAATLSCCPSARAESAPEDSTQMTEIAAGNTADISNLEQPDQLEMDTENLKAPPPVLVMLAPEYDVSVKNGIPAARDLILAVSEDSEIEVSYAQEPEIPADYADTTVTVVVQDLYGNHTEVPCVFHFHGWAKQELTLELGQTLTPEMLLENPKKDAALMKGARLTQIPEAVGRYAVTAEVGGREVFCKVTVADTTPPELTVRDVHVWPGNTVQLSDFVVSATDISGDPQIRFAAEAPDCSTMRVQTVTIEAEDASGNVTAAEAVLQVGNDTYPPQIYGASQELVMQKREKPDLLAGVYAADSIDRNPTVTVDTTSLNPEKAGTYYILYSAVDSSGNVGTFKRKVTVKHDQEDTDALVSQIAETLPDDPEAIRDYVRDNIAYNHNYGGEDPVWYGLKNRVGNCYVHALTLKAFLDLKGYETQLIWVENQSHYWLIINLEQGWRHIDATPSDQHMAVSLMTDEERYAHLNGRNWDRSAWPACE